MAKKMKNRVVKNACENCGMLRREFPMIFRSEEWCSDACRKALGHDVK